jgi:hypothetical protein
VVCQPSFKDQGVSYPIAHPHVCEDEVSPPVSAARTAPPTPPEAHVTASRSLAKQSHQPPRLPHTTSVILPAPVSPRRVYFPNGAAFFPGTARHIVPMLFREGRCVGERPVPAFLAGKRRISSRKCGSHSVARPASHPSSPCWRITPSPLAVHPRRGADPIMLRLQFPVRRTSHSGCITLLTFQQAPPAHVSASPC